jgi:hypothetical protein
MIMSLDLDHTALRDETASLGIPKSPTTPIAPGLDIGGVKKHGPLFAHSGRKIARKLVEKGDWLRG